MMNQHPLAQRVLSEFSQRYGRPATVLARAPGRVNLIGEHTDYNDGYALPVAIDRYTWVAAGPRTDFDVRATALDLQSEVDRFVLSDTTPPYLHNGGWRNYLRGSIAALHGAAPLPAGFDLVIAGDIPQGAGLSSSASLELALLHAARAVHGLPDLGPTLMALLAQQAEVNFVGCRCGIMDQLASACGVQGHALFIDFRSLQTRPVPLPAGTSLLVVHSGVSRGLVQSAYNERRQQCEQAAAMLGLASLRDAELCALEAARARMPDLIYRRARHVITENARVLSFAIALEQGDLEAMGQLMSASHRSMRDDFEITVPAIDQLVERMNKVLGREGGARMTGGGFGGCVIALAPEATQANLRRALEQSGHAARAPAPWLHCLAAAPGAWAISMGRTRQALRHKDALEPNSQALWQDSLQL